MNARDNVAYRLALAQGFLAEAQEDLQLKRWRSCVDNAQLSVENAGKAILALFGVTPKTHDPARELAAVLRQGQFPPEIQQNLQRVLPDLLALGATEHFLTDYGDEATYTLPWDIFTQESAQEALTTASHSTAIAQEVIKAIRQWRQEQTDNSR